MESQPQNPEFVIMIILKTFTHECRSSSQTFNFRSKGACDIFSISYVENRFQKGKRLQN